MKTTSGHLERIARFIVFVTLAASPSVAQARFADTSSTDELAAVIGSLPECSQLRFELEHGQTAPVREWLPYMGVMKQEGVKRAIFTVTAPMKADLVTEPFRVTRRLYFSAYDGANAQITDQQILRRLKTNGLESMLDKAALQRAHGAPVFAGIEHTKKVLRQSRYVEAEVDFFDISLFRQTPTVLAPVAKTPLPLLASAALAGDLMEVSEESQHSSKQNLNEALFFAVARPQDNTEVIKALIGAGADVNAHFGDSGSTPLMWSIPNPCNVPILLEHGADPNGRDNEGKTALRTAQESLPSGDSLVRLSITLLRKAGATLQ